MSSRLQGKVLKKINNKPLLHYLLNRVKLATKYRSDIVLATHRDHYNKKIEKFFFDKNISIFYGSKNNLLKRTFDLLKIKNYDYFVRVCGDRVIFNYEDCRKFIGLLKREKITKYDLISNKFKNHTPKGLIVEIMKVKCFKNNYRKITSKSDKEHMLNFFYRENKIKKKFIFNKIFEKYKDYNFSVDTKNDFDFIKQIYKKNKFNYKLKNNKLIKILNDSI